VRGILQDRTSHIWQANCAADTRGYEARGHE